MIRIATPIGVASCLGALCWATVAVAQSPASAPVVAEGSANGTTGTAAAVEAPAAAGAASASAAAQPAAPAPPPSETASAPQASAALPAEVNAPPVTAVAPPAVAAPAAAPEAQYENRRRSDRRRRTQPPPVVDNRPLSPLRSLMTFQLGGAGVWNRDAGYALFSKDDIGARFGFAVGADLVTLAPAVELGVELGYSYEATSDGQVAIAPASSARLQGHHPSVAALVRWDVLSMLGVYGRVQGGVSLTDLRVTPGYPGVGSDVRAEDTSPFLGLGAGLVASTPASRIAKHREYFNSITFAVRVEGGYLMAPAIALSYPSTGVEAGRPSPTRGADLGTLGRSGPYMALAGMLRF